jgi:hypothetical protein
MANVFDASSAPEQEPDQIVVGDYVRWKRTDLVSDYPLASYSMEYVLRSGTGNSNEIKIAASETGGTYLFVADSATTAAYVADHYHWQLEVTKTSTGDRTVIDRGTMEILADLDDNADPRSHAEIMLHKIESLLNGRADADVQNYAIAGRSLTKMTPDELMKWRSTYRAEVSAERDAERRRQGRPTHNTITARFI